MRIVGIDVSKDKIDAAIVAASAHRSFANSEQDQMLSWLDEHDVEKAVLEATGGYEGAGDDDVAHRPYSSVSGTIDASLPLGQFSLSMMALAGLRNLSML